MKSHKLALQEKGLYVNQKFSKKFKNFLGLDGINSLSELTELIQKRSEQLMGMSSSEADKLKKISWIPANQMIVNHLNKNGSLFPLDVGTGFNAYLSLSYLEANSKAFVSTIDDKEHRVAKHEQRHSRLMASCFDVTEASFQSGIYDGLMSSFCFEYICSTKLLKTLQALAKSLSKDAPFAIGSYGCDVAVRFPKDFGSTNFSPMYEMFGREDWNPVTLKNIKDALSKAGFEITKVTYTEPETDDPLIALVMRSRVIEGFYRGIAK